MIIFESWVPSMHLAYRFLFLCLGLLSLDEARATELNLHVYLLQVEAKNQDISSAKQSSMGLSLASREADLIYMPVLFAQTEWDENHFRNSTFPSAYRSLFIDNYTLGVRELTPYGVNFSVSYLLSHQGYLGAVDFVTGQVGDRKFWEGTPRVEMTFSLLRNWLGKETQATEEVTRATSLVNQYSQSYQAKAVRAQAETDYIKLVSAQQLVHLYEGSLANANDIYRWNDRRMKVNLGEDSDFLQSQANVESSKLLLQSSQDDLRVAASDFNRLRNLDSDTVSETLVLPSIEHLLPPPRSEVRDDVRAAQESAKLLAAQARLGQERNRPTLEAYGSFALNNRDVSVDPTFNGSFALGQQTTAYGLRLNMPLAFGILSDTVKGYELERDSSEKLVAHKVFEQDIEWKNLVQQLDEAKHRYAIAEGLAKIQKRKVENERLRLRRGRSTTYQTLIFDIDFNLAEATRIQAQGTVLNILARMKTFGEDLL